MLGRVSPDPGVAVKERIFKYLLDAGKGVAADQILRDIFKLLPTSARTSDRIIAGFLEQDPRFVRTRGLWQLRAESALPAAFDFARAVVLYLRSPDPSETLRSLPGAIRLPSGNIQDISASTTIRDLGLIRSELENHPLVMWSSREFRVWNGLLRIRGLETWKGDTLFLRDLAARALGRKPSKLCPEDLASGLGVSPADEARPREAVEYLHACWLLILERIPEEYRRDPDSLRDWSRGPGTAVDFSRFAFGPDFLRRLPATAGVYIMTDRDGNVIYVGKSGNLKRRVSSYFSRRALSQPKIARIHERLYSIDIRETDNEVEALLLEMRMIKGLRPVINLQTDIHQGGKNRHEGRNFLIFVANVESGKAKVYFFRNGISAGRQAALLGRPPSRRLEERIKSLFFASGIKGRSSGKTWEKEIASRWFAANQRRLNYLDIDEAGDYAAVLKLLRHYLCDPDKLSHKVYYR